LDTVLVVDDERAITDFVSDALIDEGYHVSVCHDGASALLDIRREPPALVLLDIGLPVMTGDLVLRELRSSGYSQLPIVVATAGTHPEQYLKIGANAVLKKPFTLENLLSTVARFTGGGG
jgi:two-component system KDP operon response regulator KdpE